MRLIWLTFIENFKKFQFYSVFLRYYEILAGELRSSGINKSLINIIETRAIFSPMYKQYAINLINL